MTKSAAPDVVELFRRLGLRVSTNGTVAIVGAERLDNRAKEVVEYLFNQYEPELTKALEGEGPEGSPRAYTLAELAALDVPEDPPSLPLLGQPGYIVEGWSHIVAALPKTGKTEMLFASAVGWAQQGRNVYWISEEQTKIWSLRAKRLAQVPENLVVAPVLSPEECEAALDEAGQDKWGVVIVDTLRHVLGLQDENSNSEVVAAIKRCEERLRGKTRIYVHHARKGEGEHGKAVAGGTAFTAAVDRVLEIRHVDGHDTRRRIHVISRLTTPHDLLVDLEDGRPVALGDPAEYTVAETANAITAVLEGQDWLTQKQIRDMLGSDVGALPVKRALDDLVQRGVVERDPPEKKQGATYKYRLASGSGGPNFTSTPKGGAEEVKSGDPKPGNFTSPLGEAVEVKSGEPEAHDGKRWF